MAAATLAPAVNAIRPLGEEHLRMFRRTAGTQTESAPRIEILKPQEQITVVSLSIEQTDYAHIQDLVAKEKCRLATVAEALSDVNFLGALSRYSFDDRCAYMDPEGTPKVGGWYRIFRRPEGLAIKYAPEYEYRRRDVPWLELLHVCGTAVDAAKKGEPLHIFIDWFGPELACDWITHRDKVKVALIRPKDQVKEWRF